MDDWLYELQNVTKEYGERRVLEVNHLQVRRGEVLAVVGPSGAGKSTLLRLLNFLEPPTEGRIRFLDLEVSANQPVPLSYRRRVTMVFQRPILLDRSVKANVRYGLRLRGCRNEDHELAAVLELVRLRDLIRQPARTLSGGEAQRVALARAIVLRPDILLLDEPTANLDPYNVGLIEGILRDLNREQGTTLVLVTHNVFQARRLAHRVALLLEGRIVEVAPVEEFFHAPKDPRTAAFVRGEMVY
ncbi:MAG: ABC transporter ATP-binding protein [Anaerolineae bacterium]